MWYHQYCSTVSPLLHLGQQDNSSSQQQLPTVNVLVLPSPVQVVFRDPVRYKLQKVLTVAAEGTYSGQVCSNCEWGPARRLHNNSSSRHSTAPAAADTQLLCASNGGRVAPCNGDCQQLGRRGAACLGWHLQAALGSQVLWVGPIQGSC